MKPGDKIKCVDASGTGNALKEGQVYTFQRYNTCMGTDLYLEDMPMSWRRDRFKLVQELANDMSPPTTSEARKEMPTFRGFMRYFPAAMALVARLSKKGNDKHNPGEELHHNRAKSGDEGDCIMRHQADVGTIDSDTNLDHAVAVAWRAMAQLQKLAEEKYGWPKAPGAK